MATLTDTAFYTRKLVRWGIVFLIGFTVLRFLIGVGAGIWRQYKPEKPPEPTLTFGKLPPLKFPENENLPELSFKLETIEGKLPTFVKVEKVYFIPKEIYSYLTLEKAEAKARALGFAGPSRKLEEISSTTYQWINQGEIPTILTMEILEGNFTIRYDYAKDQSLLNIQQVISPEKALATAKSYLGKVGMGADVRGGGVNFVYFRYTPEKLVEVNSLVETDFVRVTLLRQPIEKKPVLPPNLKKGNIYALVSKGRTSVIDAEYTYYPVDLEVSGTYPLKDSTDAWDDLKRGNHYISDLGDNEDGKITIRKVYLAYYDPPEHQNFLQPIFVFEGDGGFRAYVAALSEKAIEE